MKMCVYKVLFVTITLECTNLFCAGLQYYGESKFDQYFDLEKQHKSLYSVRHAALPEGVDVYPLPLIGSDHELMFNVTWRPPHGPHVQEYSLEVHSLTDTTDCRSNLCYEYNIPGASLWSVIPTRASPVQEGCAVRPGCAYKVKLIAHPWDGHTAASIDVKLDECVAGVCSCAHGPRLPVPTVTARTISINGELFANITWTLPPPKEPLRIPPRLMKKFYFVSLGKQMVSDAHPAPWYAHTISRKVDAFGFVVVPDVKQWQLLPVTERSHKSLTNIVLDVKLLARVSLVDERGCVGPAGNATAYDPAEVARLTLSTWALWAAFSGACVVTMVVILGISARIVKRILNKFRPASISAPLQPMAHRPLWFPLGTPLLRVARGGWNVAALVRAGKDRHRQAQSLTPNFRRNFEKSHTAREPKIFFHQLPSNREKLA